MKRLVYCIFLLLSLSINAQNQFYFDETVSQKSVEKNLFYTDDSTFSKVNVFTVLESNIKWKPYYKDLIKEEGTFWLKLPITNKMMTTAHLVIGNSNFDFVDYYVPDINGHLIKKRAGLKRDFENIDLVTSPYNYADFYIGPNQSHDIFIKVRNTSPNGFQYAPLEFSVSTWENFEQVKSSRNAYSLIFFGAIIIMTLYNLTLFFLLKDKTFGYYVFNNITLIVFVGAQLGGLNYFYFQNSYYHDTVLLVIGNIQLVAYLLFTVHVLNLKDALPAANQLIRKIIIGYPFLLLLIFVSEELAVSLGGLVAVFCYNYILYVSWKVLKSGFKPAKYFLIANLFYYVGVSVSMMQIFGVLPNLIWGLSAMSFVEIGTLFQLFLFSLTLGNRFNKIKEALANELLEKERIKREEEKNRSMLIEEQNVKLESEVKKRTAELETKNKDITDSINYARKIQDAILPTKEQLASTLNQHFVLYLPRDIVSGDFYWHYHLKDETQDKVFLAAVDCTGHGVPGAFMSMIGYSALNKIITDFNITHTDEILNALQNEIYLSLKQERNENKDGMDIALCMWDKKNNLLEFSGAQNPLVYYKNDERIVIKGDNISIGGHYEIDRKFSRHTVDITQDMTVYLFSDGFHDQFGGENNKKFKKSRLFGTFDVIHSSPLIEQKQVLLETFFKWKQTEEQLDDVIVLGFKLAPQSI